MATRDYDALAIILGASVSDDEDLVDPARYYSTAGFCTGIGDTPEQVAFLGRIAEDIEYNREFTCVFWQGQTRGGPSIGAVQLLNNDGRLDELRTKPIRDRTVEIYRGLLTEPFEDWELCGSAIADRVEFPSLDRCVLVMADLTVKLDRPMQQATYTGSGNTAIIGQVKPFAIGPCLSIPAIPWKLEDLRYDVHDDTPAEVTKVRANGVERAETAEWELNGNGFKLLTSPFGRIVADATGEDEPRLPGFLNYGLIDRGLLSSGDLDTDTIDALDTATEYTLNFFADRPVSGKQFLAETMASFGGGYWVNRLNKISVGRLQAPDDPVLTIDETVLDVDGTLVVEFDRAPGYSNICAGQRNWYVHQANEIASSLTDPVYEQIAVDLQQDYRVRKTGVPSGSGDSIAGSETAPRDGAAVYGAGNLNTGIGTLLTNATHIQAEATRWVVLFEQRRHFWTVPVLLAPSTALELEPCLSVTLSLSDGRYGLDTPRDLLVVGIRGRFLSGRVELRLWG